MGGGDQALGLVKGLLGRRPMENQERRFGEWRQLGFMMVNAGKWRPCRICDPAWEET